MMESIIKHSQHNFKKKEVKSKFSNKFNEDKHKSTYVLPIEHIYITDEQKQKYFKKMPFYNFAYAEEELGFTFCDFAKNNFGEFLSTCYVTDLINLRKNYIMRNLVQVRFIAHKLKSPFGYI